MEIELKLLLAPADLRSLAANPQVRSVTRTAHRSAVLQSVYFDTPGGDLRARGLALRLRRERGRWIQTLKGPGEAVAGMHARGEFEWRVPGEALDLELLGQTPYAKLFGKRRVREALSPVFVTEFRRRVLDLAFPDGTEAELCLDAGEIRAGRRSAEISEAEIEIVKGDTGVLIDFAIALSETVPFRLGHESKAERAWRLALGQEPSPRKTGRPDIDPRAGTWPALAAVISDCLVQMSANGEGVIEGRDPEFLHQLRIGLRRLRIALSLLDDGPRAGLREEALPEIRALSAVLGPARNWDVFVTELLPPIARHCGFRQVAGLRARAGAQRRRHARAAAEAIASPRFARLCLRISSALVVPEPSAGRGSQAGTLPVRRFAAQALNRRRRKLVRCVPVDARPSAEALHHVRIAAKKLRYTAEFFATVYPRGKARRHSSALAALQAVLGEANDASVAQRMIEQAAQAGRRPLAPELRGLAQGWVAATEARARDAFGNAWKNFEQVKPFW